MKKKLDSIKMKQVSDEIRDKVNNYESRTAYRLARWTEMAELLQQKTATNQNNFKSVANTAELLKAVRALTAMSYRMLTSQAPFFELECNDLLGYNDPSKLVYAEHYIQNQLDITNYRSNLWKALYQTYLYGTVAVHETYEPIKGSLFGLPRYATTFKPMPMVNCAFSLDSFTLSECTWVALNDVVSKQYLETILRSDPKGELYDISQINEAYSEKYEPQVNNWVRQRMAWAGYYDAQFHGGMELCTYYGPLDTLNDGKEYVVDVVNRTHVIRIEEYIGLRPVRIATINELDIEPLGNGLGDLFRPLLKQMDDTRSALINTTTFAGANMFTKNKSTSEEDINWEVRNFGIIELDGPVVPLGPNPSTIPILRGQLQDLVQEFRQASGASDTLQAIVKGDSATATEVSLAMNEAVRNISVTSEMLAIPLVRDHIKVILQNAFKYQNSPLTLNIDKTPITITPDKLKIDLGVRVKTMTDQDFRPSKVNHLLQVLQFMSSIPTNAMEGYKVSVVPTLLEILKTMDVPQFAKSITPISEEDLMRAQIINTMQQPQQPNSANVTPDSASQQRINDQRPGKMEERAVNGIENQVGMDNGTLRTPAGEVLSAPGTENMSLANQRSASVGTESVNTHYKR